MVQREFCLVSCEGGKMLVGAENDPELLAMSYAGVARNGICAVELLSAQEYRTFIDAIHRLPEEVFQTLDIYLARFGEVWNSEQTQASLDSFLCCYAELNDCAVFLEHGGRRYLCRPDMASQILNAPN